MTQQRAQLRSQNRLITAAQFKAVLKRKSLTQDKLMRVFAIPNGMALARLGLAVSRRVSPRAVDRNRIKRQIRESFRQHQILLKGLDVVVVSNPAARTSGNNDIRDALQQHWQHINKKCKTR